MLIPACATLDADRTLAVPPAARRLPLPAYPTNTSRMNGPSIPIRRFSRRLTMALALLACAPLPASACVSVSQLVLGQRTVEADYVRITYRGLLMNRCETARVLFTTLKLYGADGTVVDTWGPIRHKVRGTGLSRIAGKARFKRDTAVGATYYDLEVEEPL